MRCRAPCTDGRMLLPVLLAGALAPFASGFVAPFLGASGGFLQAAASGEVFAAPKSQSFSSWVGDLFVQTVLNSPASPLIIQQAKDTMKNTALKNGIQWDELLEVVRGERSLEEWNALKDEVLSKGSDVVVPGYYKMPFHAYKEGNLEWLAAFEQAIAGKAVGSRNFPKAGKDGEDVLRKCYDAQLTALGAVVEKGGLIVDMGCGTGTSAQYLANLYPHAGRIMGYDLSPYMVVVGRHRLQSMEADFRERVSIDYADMSATPLPDGCASMVSISYVFHEMSNEGRRASLLEAYRLLKPGGTVAIMEMDPEAPGYVALRNNPFLFAIFKSTEPWLLEYFDAAPQLPAELQQVGFVSVAQSAATGRHFCMVGRKQGFIDIRPSNEERLATDDHMILLKDD